MSASLADLPQNVLELIIEEGQLSLANIASLLLVNHACNHALSSRNFTIFLLKHFFPFAAETHEYTHSQVKRVENGTGYSSRNIPFPSLPTPPHQDPRQSLKALCTRLSRLRKRNWSAVWEFSFGAYDKDEAMPGVSKDLWFSDGFFLIDVAGGFLLTAATEEKKGEIILSVGNLDGRRTVKIVVPMDPFKVAEKSQKTQHKSTSWTRGRTGILGTADDGWSSFNRPGIFLRFGKVLIIYDHPRHDQSLFLLKDASLDGRTLWTAVLDTKVCLGIEPVMPIVPSDLNEYPMAHLYHRRLEPIFNEFYVAFLDAYSALAENQDPKGNITICRFVPNDPQIPLNCFATDIVAGPETIDIQTDTSGQVLLVSSRLKNSRSNTYRVSMIDAGGKGDAAGANIGDYDMAMARHFREGTRDMEIHISEDNEQLVIYGSSHLDAYRRVVLGQLSIYELSTRRAHVKTPAKQRYFLTPVLGNDAKYACCPFACRTSYDMELSTLIYTQRPRPTDPLEALEPRFVRYESLNLNVKSAGLGEITNQYNTRPSRWIASIPAIRETMTAVRTHQSSLSASISIGPGSTETKEYHLHTISSKNWICVLSARYTTNPATSVTKLKKVIRLYSIGEAPGADFSASASQTPSHSHTPSEFLQNMSGASSAGGPDPRTYSGRTRSPMPNALVYRESLDPSPKLSIQEKDMAQQQAVMHARLLAQALEAERAKRERGEHDPKWGSFGDAEQVEHAKKLSAPPDISGLKGGEKTVKKWKKLLKFGR